MIEVAPLSPSDPRAIALIEALDELQTRLYPAESNHLDSTEELSRSNVHFLGAADGETLLGCAALKRHAEAGGGPDYGELKRMFVTPAARGRGVARALMDAIEAHAVESGMGVVRLETGIYQPEAIGLYERMGFVRRGPFGDYAEDPLSVFMEKRLHD